MEPGIDREKSGQTEVNPAIGPELRAGRIILIARFRRHFVAHGGVHAAKTL